MGYLIISCCLYTTGIFFGEMKQWRKHEIPYVVYNLFYFPIVKRARYETKNNFAPLSYCIIFITKNTKRSGAIVTNKKYISCIINNDNYRPLLWHSPPPPPSLFLLVLWLLIFSSTYVRAVLKCDTNQERGRDKIWLNVPQIYASWLPPHNTMLKTGHGPMLNVLWYHAHGEIILYSCKF